MGAHSFSDLLHHVGHKIVCVTYGLVEHISVDEGDIWNVAVECEDCNTVLMDYNWDENIYEMLKEGEEGDDGLPTNE